MYTVVVAGDPPHRIIHVPSGEIKHNDCDFRNGTESSVFFVILFVFFYKILYILLHFDTSKIQI